MGLVEFIPDRQLFLYVYKHPQDFLACYGSYLYHCDMSIMLKGPQRIFLCCLQFWMRFVKVGQ